MVLETKFKKTTLSNGLKVLTESVVGRASVHLGLHLLWGSVDEPKSMSGAAHLIEHMVFKGTTKRSAYQIVGDIEAVGGDIGASTGKEMTSYTVQCLKKDVELGVDILGDLCLSADFKEDDFVKEKDVVLSEIAMSDENFEESVFDLAFEDIFKGEALGRPILGTAETVKSISCQELFKVYSENYKTENMVFSVSGDVDHDEIVFFCEKYFSNEDRQIEKNINVNSTLAPKEIFLSSTRFVEKKTEQAHVLLNFKAPAFPHQDRIKSYLANVALGGGMTSILYQKIREDLGLAYTVYSYLQCFMNVGVMSIYVGTRPDKGLRVIELVAGEIERLVKEGLTKKELELYRQQLLGEVLMGQDDLDSRMNSIALNELVFQTYKTPLDLAKEVRGIDLDAMNEYFKKYLDMEPSIILLGAKTKP